MNRWMILLVGSALFSVAGGVPGWAGDFKKSYGSATQPGAWSQYQLAAQDGSASTYTYTRKPDDDGRVVLELAIKAADSESKMTYTMPPGFDVGRDGLSYGKFTEKMTMQYGDMIMPVDESTLEVIRGAEKDYRGRVTFVAAEPVGALMCDRYSYDLSSAPSKETGTLWLNEAVPFAVVKHEGTVVGADGQKIAEFTMTLADHGKIETAAEETAVTPEPVAPALPAEVTLAEGYAAGYIGLEVTAQAGGRQLSLVLVNKTESPMTVSLPEGELDLTVDSPVNTLKITSHLAQRTRVPAGETSSPLVVDQRGPYGIAQGTCSLSVYEGSPIFTGSVTMDQLPK